MGTMTFQINDSSLGATIPVVWVTITENPDGSLTFSVTQPDSAIGDLRGLFFDVADESILGSLQVVANSSDIRIGNDNIIDLGQGANVTGLGGSDGGYDVGIKIGTSGIGTDDVSSFSFTLRSSARALTLADLSSVDFAARLTSVGTLGGTRADSAKIGEVSSQALLLSDVATTVYEDTQQTGQLWDGTNLSGQTTVTGWSGGSLGSPLVLTSNGDDIASLTVNSDGSYVLDANVGDPLSHGETIVYTFTFEARNQDETTSWSTDDATFEVTVIGVNDGPDAQDDAGGEVAEDAILVGDVTVNDSDVDRLDTHTWSLVDGSFNGLGELRLNADGTWSYDAQGAYDGLVDGQSVELSFEYTMTDNHGASDTAVVTFKVLGEGQDDRGGGGGGGGGGGDSGGGDPPTRNDFPLWLQDISNITLVFDQTAGDVKPSDGGDGYYTVKINVDGAFPDDLDVSIDEILKALDEKDPYIDSGSDLLGVVIKGGLQTTQFYAYGSHNTNGVLPDTLPADLGFALTGTSSNVDPVNAIDAGYDYATLILS